jgi:hypothetical protein
MPTIEAVLESAIKGMASCGEGLYSKEKELAILNLQMALVWWREYLKT